MKRGTGVGWTSLDAAPPAASKDTWEFSTREAGSPKSHQQQQQQADNPFSLQQPTNPGPLRSSLRNHRYAKGTEAAAAPQHQRVAAAYPDLPTSTSAAPSAPAATTGHYPASAAANTGSHPSNYGTAAPADPLLSLAASAAGALLSHPSTAAAAGAVLSAAAGAVLQRATAPPPSAAAPQAGQPTSLHPQHQQQRLPTGAAAAAAGSGGPGVPPRCTSPQVQQQQQQQSGGRSGGHSWSGSLSAAAGWLRSSRKQRVTGDQADQYGSSTSSSQSGAWWGESTPTRRNLAALAHADPLGPVLLAPDGGAMPGPGSTLAAGPAGSPALAGQQAAVVALRGLLLWRHPLASGAALGAGAYLILLLACIPTAVKYLQPTTAVAASGLLLMAYAGVKPYLLHYAAALARRPKQQLMDQWATLEARLLSGVARGGQLAGQQLWAYSAALVWLGQRAILGRSFTTSAFAAAALWMLLLMSELRLFGQLLPALVAWCSLFLVPWLLHQFRRVVDGVVSDTLHVAGALVLAADHWTNAVAAGLALAIWGWLGAGGVNWVVCATVSGAAALGYLAWSAWRR